MTSPLDDLEAVRQVVETLEPFDTPDRERILRWVREKLGLTIVQEQNQSQQTLPPSKSDLGGGESGGGGSVADIKAFVASKKPANDQAFAATVAYYYRFEAQADQRKDAITKEDLIEACRLAGRARLQDPTKTLNNAHTSGLVDREGRGAYRISTVGENLVAMTLGVDGVSQPPRPSRPRRKTKSNTKKKPTTRKKAIRAPKSA